MAFKFVVFAAVLAYANAGFIAGPATYSAAPAVSNAYLHQATAPAVAVAAHASPVAIHDPAYGSSHQSVLRSLGGSHAVSHYTKAFDSAFSTVRKYDTRITNDAVTVAHAPVVSTYAAHAPVAVAHHAGPIVSTYAAQAPVAVAHHAAPVVSSYAAHAPLVSAPVVAKTAAVAYSPAAVASHVTFSGLGTSYAW